MFVTFEGPEGGGKTTLIEGLRRELEARGRSVVVTREPGSGDFGRQIRAILLDGGAIEPLSELFLFLADRSEHVAKVVRPALARGELVLCDRHADSTIVYQGYGRGMDIDELRRLNAMATGGLAPDLTILLDLDPEIGLSRRTNRNRLDDESLEFHKRVRQGFLLEAARANGRLVTIDATRPPEETLALVIKLLIARMN